LLIHPDVAITTRWMLALTLTLAAAGCDEAEGETVGREGGVVTSADGRVTLDIPAGALADDVAIRIDEVEAGPDGTLGYAYEVQPAGLVLALPAELTFEVDLGDDADEFDLVDPAVALERLALVIDKGASWDRLADLQFDGDAGVVSASALYLGTFALTADGAAN
jgi:hypothetical protein